MTNFYFNQVSAYHRSLDSGVSECCYCSPVTHFTNDHSYFLLYFRHLANDFIQTNLQRMHNFSDKKKHDYYATVKVQRSEQQCSDNNQVMNPQSISFLI